MPKRFPYIITNVFLNETIIDVTSVLLKDKGHYFVFWWHSIPLGDLYIDSSENLNRTNFQTLIIKAIMPALNFYAQQTSVETDFKEAFLSDNYDRLSQLLNKLLAAYLPFNLPDKVDISVVICTRNRSQHLQLCLESLQKQASVPMEIIVVDNAPSDNSTRLIAEKFAKVKYILEEKPGLDIARNAGAMNATYPIIAYTDDDVVLPPLWTYRVWQSFLLKDTDAITGLVIAASLTTESQQIFEKHWSFNKGYIDKIFDKRFLTSPAPRVWEIGAGANMAFRKEVLEKVNYFDERLDVGAAGCSGDSEIWYRILLAGFTIKYDPRVAVYHDHRKEISALHKQIFSYMRGHAASVLIQHQLNRKAGYKKYLFKEIPKYYLLLLRMGFPFYSFRYKTLLSEIKGLISGVRFYNKNKSKPPISLKA
ncbi:MAG TPA: glycosyltransferase [Segetibacter sp.]|jgi:glycosyltransferase involved in cell wall biosynthesis